MTPSPSPSSIAMDLGDLIEIDAILPSMKAGTKKQVLQELCEKAAERTGLSGRDIFETVLQREKLGSTGVGNGIAIPHGKLPELPKLVGVFGRLNRPVDFDALDDQPVDLVFLLLAPGGSGAEHLKALSKIARLLRNATTVARLREARDADTIYALMTERSAPGA
ncbi:PTS IIA-like nitrogen-regulatory protein PtsN [Aureimonas endophytica]|uniref:PTS IIA-like nitrogen-regulatory protein PtsN n=2 Tax=Aureimonas endophytica TaxID=2027858 RepID=A0A917A0S2_9HYPH|nr:PTS IIA-like nitrogen-regulatory protein PtsN [Aureimonas endophytica]